jgi:acyl-CoA hydrolase
VTASMGDVVIEHYPKIGELLELRASPVDKGNTSLNIAVSVVAHGCSGGGDGDDDENDDNDDGENDGENENRTVCTKRVCEAFFTYVTTRGPDGGKRYVPPLQTTTMDGEDAWERTLARFRKKLIRSEQSVTKHRIDYTIARHKAIFESSEVVLPSHQNHMSHLFGGVVMGWMCKSVTAACVMATRLPLTKFRIRAIQRVDFPKGAEVSGKYSIVYYAVQYSIV